MKRSESKYKTMEKLGINDDTSTDYLENVYEAWKMFLQSLMALEGFKPYSHEAIIAFAMDELEMDMIDANALNRYRKLRNDIAYRGGNRNNRRSREHQRALPKTKRRTKTTDKRKTGSIRSLLYSLN